MGSVRSFPVPGPGEEEEELDEGIEEEEEEEETETDDESTGTEAARSEVVEARVEKKRSNKRNRRPSPRGPRNPEKADWPRDVEELWMTILAWLPSKGRRPEDVSIQIAHMGGQPMAATITWLEPKIRGDQVLGDSNISPGDALKNMIIDVFHAKFAQRGRYKAKFFFPVPRNTSHGWEHIRESEEFTLDDIGTINLRRQMASGYQARPYGFGAMPQPQMPMGSPGGGYSPYGQANPAMPFGQPYLSPYPTHAQTPFYMQPPAPGPNPAQEMYARQMAEMHGMTMQLINELRKENAELRGQPPPAPVQIPMPAPPPVAPSPVIPPVPSPLEQRLDRLLDVLVARPVASGLGAAATAVGAQPSAVDPIESELRSLTVGLMRGVVKKVIGEVQTAITGTVEPSSSTEVPAPQTEAEATPDPKEKLPFEEVALDAKWSNGSPVIYTPSKDGTGVGGVSPMGFVTSNPFVVEKLTEVVGGTLNRLGEAFSDAVSRMTAGGAAHVVSRVPAGAVSAGVAAAPAQQEPSHAPPPPPPASTTSGGWPQT